MVWLLSILPAGKDMEKWLNYYSNEMQMSAFQRMYVNYTSHDKKIQKSNHYQ